MAKIETEIIIAAPYDRVRELLADTGLYPQWNPLFPRLNGEMKRGAQVEVAILLPEIKPFTLRVTLEEVHAGERLSWRYAYPLPGIFSWTYRYDLEEIENGRVKFNQISSYAGLLSPLYYWGMKKSLQCGLGELNRAVQRWGERRGISCLKC